MEGQVGLGEMSDQRAYSAPINPNQDELKESKAGRPPGSPDSSSSRSSQSSNLSDLDSATELQRGRDGKNTSNHNSKGLLPTEKVNPLELIDEQGYKSASQKDLPIARPPSAPRPDSQNGIRPGSDRHMVLPPIQNVAA